MDWGLLLFLFFWGASADTASFFVHKGEVRKAHFVRPNVETLAEYLEQRNLEMTSKEGLNKIQIYFEFVRNPDGVTVYPYLKVPWRPAPEPLNILNNLTALKATVIENHAKKDLILTINNDALNIEYYSINPDSTLEITARYQNQPIRYSGRLY